MVNELHGFQVLLANAFELKDSDYKHVTITNPGDEHSGTRNSVEVEVLESLFRCWCQLPAATYLLCLLARVDVSRRCQPLVATFLLCLLTRHMVWRLLWAEIFGVGGDLCWENFISLSVLQL